MITLYYVPDCEIRARGFTPWCELQAVDTPPRLQTGHALWLDDAGLALLNADFAKPFRLTSDMLESRLQGSSLLSRACAGERQSLSLLDPFGGFGLDAFLLAHQNYRVTILENNPSVWLMMREFALDLGLDIETACTDAMSFLADNREFWDVVYLDPMFPTRRKRALPNLGLQHLQSLTIEADIDLEACLVLATSRARLRVVLKRRLKDPVIGRPSHQLKGQAVRFDVYV